jgi:PhnB protein
MSSKLNPYLTFAGNAREAMAFYQEVLGGELSLMTYAEGGGEDVPQDADRIMHGQIDVPNGMTLMGADAPSGEAQAAPSGMAISLSGADEAELSGYFAKLAEGGTIVEPLVRAPWGDQFGMVTDRFGVLWMVNIAGQPQE